MAYISHFSANKAIETIGTVVVSTFGEDAVLRQIEQQRDVYEGRKDVTNVLTSDQEKDKREGKPFVADLIRAEDHGKVGLYHSVTMRIKGAYAAYQQSDELECIRYIIVALGSICEVLGWVKASKYLNEQNRVLYNMKKEEVD